MNLGGNYNAIMRYERFEQNFIVSNSKYRSLKTTPADNFTPLTLCYIFPIHCEILLRGNEVFKVLILVMNRYENDK